MSSASSIAVPQLPHHGSHGDVGCGRELINASRKHRRTRGPAAQAAAPAGDAARAVADRPRLRPMLRFNCFCNRRRNWRCIG